MGNAKYIGRVGALAVALGIGAAVATTPGVALAEQGSESAGSDALPSSQSTSATSPSDATKPASVSTSQTASGANVTSQAAVTTIGSPTAQTNGGVKTGSVRDTRVESALKPFGPFESAAQRKPEIPTAFTRRQVITPSAAASSISAVPTKDPHQPSLPRPNVRNFPSVSAAPTQAVATPNVVRQTQPRAMSSVPVPQAASAAAPREPAAVDGPPTRMNVVSAVVSSVFSALGMTSSASTAPAAPPDSPLLWGILAWARRQIGQASAGESAQAQGLATSTSQNRMSALTTDFPTESLSTFTTAAVNRVPVAGVPVVGIPSPTTGVVTGSLNVSDPDGDSLIYSVSTQPSGGAVTVDAAGGFVYTPSAAARLVAGQTSGVDSDGFTVAVSDGQVATAVTVAVPVSPVVVGSAVSSVVGVNPIGVAVSASKAYVANSASNTVSVIDRSTGAVTAINVVGVPTSVAVSADGARVYVAGYNGVSVIDAATNRVLATVVTNGGQSYGIAVSPNGQRVYVSGIGTSTVSVINVAAATPTVIAQVPVGFVPAGVVVSADGQRVYVANFYGNSVSVINTATNTVVGNPIAVGANPVSVVLGVDGTRAYVTNYGSNSVSVINTATNTVVGNPIAVGLNPFGLAISADGSVLYAANSDDTVSVINTKTSAVITTQAIDGAPEFGWHGIAVSPDGRQIYVSDTSDQALRTLTVSTPAPPNRAPVAGTPTVGAPNPTTGAISGSLNFTDPDANTLTYSVPTQPASGTVTVTATGTYTYTPTPAARTQAAQTPGTDLASITVIASDGKTSTPVTFTVPIVPSVVTATPLFVGDYTTGNFGQWAVVQNRFYNSVASGYTSTYAAALVNDPVYGTAVRYEVRPGDVPNFGGGERSEVQGDTNTGGTEGQVRWYEFATKFDANFPTNHADLGWGLVNQWHADSSVGSPPVGWYVDQRNGYWSLVIHKQAAPGQYLQTIDIYDAPLNPGVWQDVKMEVYWSASDAKGYIRLWMNGQRVTFKDGSDTYHVRTLIPGTTSVYYKEGYYRQAGVNRTGVVYHAGFRVAGSEAGLYTGRAPMFGGTGGSSDEWWLTG